MAGCPSGYKRTMVPQSVWENHPGPKVTPCPTNCKQTMYSCNADLGTCYPDPKGTKSKADCDNVCKQKIYEYGPEVYVFGGGQDDVDGYASRMTLFDSLQHTRLYQQQGVSTFLTSDQGTFDCTPWFDDATNSPNLAQSIEGGLGFGTMFTLIQKLLVTGSVPHQPATKILPRKACLAFRVSTQHKTQLVHKIVCL